MGHLYPTQARFYRYIEKQTSLPNLILYVYLFWYLFLMLSVGARHMNYMSWLNGVFVACFVFFALNAAAYQPPMCGATGYTKHPFKIARFFLIPFGVSTASVACGAAGDANCMLLFPTDMLLMWIQMVVMILLFCIGFAVHYFVAHKLVLNRLQQIDSELKIKDIAPTSVPDDDDGEDDTIIK